MESPVPHTVAIVPIEVWAYQSPALLRDEALLDLGLLAEALIYYDRVLVIPESGPLVGEITPAPGDLALLPSEPTRLPRFVSLVEWFEARGLFGEFIELVESGALGIYHYAFRPVPLQRDGVYCLVNVQDADEQEPDFFVRRILQHPALDQIIQKARHRARLYRALRENIVEVKANAFGPAIDNAVSDFANKETARLAVQALIDEVFELAGWKEALTVEVATSERDGRFTNTWNVDFRALGEALGRPSAFSIGMVLCGFAHSNRALWSAATMGADLYLPAPTSRLVGTKLAEASERLTRAQANIDRFKLEVEFPDVRTLVNSGALDFRDAVKLRGKAGRFRRWLQQESDRDRNALIAYHQEVAEGAGWRSGTRTTIQFAAATGAGALGAAVADPVVGGAVGAGASFLVQLAARLGNDWRPVVFGNWASAFVSRKARVDAPRLR